MKMFKWEDFMYQLALQHNITKTVSSEVYNAIQNCKPVDAIPIEWIKEWLNKCPLYEDSVCDLLEDWRKENA